MVSITFTPTRHGVYHVHAKQQDGHPITTVANVPGAHLRETIERMSEEYSDVRTQPIPSNTFTWI